jgi:hypothetical protein
VLQVVSNASVPEDDLTVVVDYAHTPDALLNVLRTVRESMAEEPTGDYGHGLGGDATAPSGRLWEKRCLASAIAIATRQSAQRRPATILAEIKPGLDKVGGSYEMLVDRREAIFRAIEARRCGRSGQKAMRTIRYRPPAGFTLTTGSGARGVGLETERLASSARRATDGAPAGSGPRRLSRAA